jgi:hypothetical protein
MTFLGIVASPIYALTLFDHREWRSKMSMQMWGTVGSDGRYILGTQFNGAGQAAVKFLFANLTVGTKLSLCAGTMSEFDSGTCAVTLGSSDGPASLVLAIVGGSILNDKVLWIRRDTGQAASRFALTIE